MSRVSERARASEEEDSRRDDVLKVGETQCVCERDRGWRDKEMKRKGGRENVESCEGQGIE